ncbi:MAG TPA: type I methionyl aminopeptidase [Anaerolineaceae bacterium]|nr:type I methionyl aminopeptidase [Anaerolineaceae bacterium]
MMSWERQITIKTPHEIEIMRQAGAINAEALQAAADIAAPGVTTADLNAAAEAVLKSYGVVSPFKNYPGPYPYPASTNVSINEELVHGIPNSKRKLVEGDIVSVDCGTIYQGFVADSAITVPIGKVSDEVAQLLAVTEEALYKAIAQCVPGKRVGDISSAVEQYVESQGLCVTREYTGHGVGRQMHEGPSVPNYGTPGRGMLLRAGMTIAIEPMVLIGTPQTKVVADQWTVISRNEKPTAHFEHSVAITPNGPRILTLLKDAKSPGRNPQERV